MSQEIVSVHSFRGIVEGPFMRNVPASMLNALFTDTGLLPQQSW
jgi:hypothetical protein